MPSLTLLDIAKMNGSDAVVGLIDEAVRGVPELSGINPHTMTPIPGVGTGRTITGQNFKTLIRTSLPSVGFRNANEGRAETKSTYENRLFETFILNPAWSADKAVADRHEDGWQSLLALEADAHMKAAMMELASQFYYGVSNDAKGHPGLQAFVSSAMTVDATGSSAGTGSSVYAVKWGLQAVAWLWGTNGQLQLSDVSERDRSDGTNNYTAYFQELTAYPGLQTASVNAVGRVKNLTEDSGKGLTDTLLAKLYELFPLGQKPDVFFCSKRSWRQLKASRTATNQTGAPAPFPTEFEGIPICPTEALLNNETIA